VQCEHPHDVHLWLRAARHVGIPSTPARQWLGVAHGEADKLLSRGWVPAWEVPAAAFESSAHSGSGLAFKDPDNIALELFVPLA